MGISYATHSSWGIAIQCICSLPCCYTSKHRTTEHAKNIERLSLRTRRSGLGGIGLTGGALLAGCGMRKVESKPKSVPTLPTDAWYDESVTGDISLIEDEVFRLGNEARREHGVGELQYNADLSQVVRYHCWDQIERGYYGHVNPERKSPGDRVDDAGLGVNTVSENLVKKNQGFIPGREIKNAHVLMNSWLGSVDHREALLDPKYTHTDVGLYAGEDGSGVIGQLFAKDYMKL